MKFREHGVLQTGLSPSRFAALGRVATIAAAAGLGVYATITALKAFEEAFANDQFPEALAVKVEELPFIFPLHMVTGGLALLLVPLALMLRHTRWHKLAGRVVAADVAVAGVTALPVALVSPVTPVSAAGFTAQGVVWTGLLAAGIWNIRRGNVTAHRDCMLMMAAVMTGAMFFRLYLGLWALFGTRAYFKLFYACDAWIAWLLPLIAMALYLRRDLFRSHRPASVRTG